MSHYSTNPVRALQERFQSRSLVPQYKMIQGAWPVFAFQVSLDDVTVTGTGISMKRAKQAAAKALLEKLDERVWGGILPSTEAEVPPFKQTVTTQNGCKDDSEVSLTINANFLGSDQTEATNNSDFMDDKNLDLMEYEEKCLKNPQKSISRNGIKINLLKLEKSKHMTELSSCENNESKEDFQHSYLGDFQMNEFQLKETQFKKFEYFQINELPVKTGNNNIVKNEEQGKPGSWMENIKTPEKCRPSVEKFEWNHHQSRDKKGRREGFAENETGRSKEREMSRERFVENERRNGERSRSQPSQIESVEKFICDMLNNVRHVDLDKKSEYSNKICSRESEPASEKSWSRRKSRSPKPSISPGRYRGERHQRSSSGRKYRGEREWHESNYSKERIVPSGSTSRSTRKGRQDDKSSYSKERIVSSGSTSRSTRKGSYHKEGKAEEIISKTPYYKRSTRKNYFDEPHYVEKKTQFKVPSSNDKDFMKRTKENSTNSKHLYHDVFESGEVASKRSKK